MKGGRADSCTGQEEEEGTLHCVHSTDEDPHRRGLAGQDAAALEADSWAEHNRFHQLEMLNRCHAHLSALVEEDTDFRKTDLAEEGSDTLVHVGRESKAESLCRTPWVEADDGKV